MSGTIKYTDDAGVVENIVLGTEEKPLTLDMTEVSDTIHLGNGVDVANVGVGVENAVVPLRQVTPVSSSILARKTALTPKYSWASSIVWHRVSALTSDAST